MVLNHVSWQRAFSSNYATLARCLPENVHGLEAGQELRVVRGGALDAEDFGGAVAQVVVARDSALPDALLDKGVQSVLQIARAEDGSWLGVSPCGEIAKELLSGLLANVVCSIIY